MQKEGQKIHDADNADRHKKKDKKVSFTVSINPCTNSLLIKLAKQERRTRAHMARLLIEDSLD